MRNLVGLVELAFGHAQEISNACTELERSPGLRGHGFYGVQIADAAVSALAHISAASITCRGTYRERLEAKLSVRGARAQFGRLKELVRVVHAQRYIEEQEATALLERINEAQALLLAVSLELATPAVA